ncbi:glycosyltransferase [Haloarcula sp. S1CR25-12]|uniref:Glycosyltransferase n=1 Tax=Haloarcula saliterrae TaxID=2950534 RepID=A0ABU2FGG0_9EURY|nr:glycosyltransferase family 2 protein [Haloarcula sp. S1CR25-12]MDS0261344.1 glycosyltransferase [Haloarcula sp. S1CR25-12]
MDFSIVTPVYNDPRIRSTIDSVRAQRTDFDVEHVVVDGQSTDETVGIIERSRDEIDTLVRQDDDGVYDAMNTGIEAATGDVVGILNADDRYQDAAVLQDIHDRLRETGAETAYGDLVYVDDSDDVVRYWESGQFRPYKFYLGWLPPHPTFFVRRSLYERYGTFDKSLHIAGDYELMLRLLRKHDVSTAYVDRVLVRMANGGQSNESVGNMLLAVREMYDSWRKHRLAGRYVAPFLHPVEKLPQFVRDPPGDAVETQLFTRS